MGEQQPEQQRKAPHDEEDEERHVGSYPNPGEQAPRWTETTNGVHTQSKARGSKYKAQAKRNTREGIVPRK